MGPTALSANNFTNVKLEIIILFYHLYDFAWKLQLFLLPKGIK